MAPAAYTHGISTYTLSNFLEEVFDGQSDCRLDLVCSGSGDVCRRNLGANPQADERGEPEGRPRSRFDQRRDGRHRQAGRGVCQAIRGHAVPGAGDGSAGGGVVSAHGPAVLVGENAPGRRPHPTARSGETNLRSSVLPGLTGQGRRRPELFGPPAPGTKCRVSLCSSRAQWTRQGGGRINTRGCPQWNAPSCCRGGGGLKTRTAHPELLFRPG